MRTICTLITVSMHHTYHLHALVALAHHNLSPITDQHSLCFGRLCGLYLYAVHRVWFNLGPAVDHGKEIGNPSSYGFLALKMVPGPDPKTLVDFQGSQYFH